jgi:probable O-glycosylation ligase (exosortase A-associated)
VWILLALWLVFFLSTMFAIYPDDAWRQFSKVSKILLMTLVMLLLLQEDRKIRALIWVIGGSLAFFGIKGGLFAIATGGQYHVLGPPDSFIGGNTEIALALNMAIPLLVFLKRETQQPWVRRFLVLAIVLCPVAIVSTYSRGGFLGLAVVLSVLLLKSRRRVVVTLVVVGGLLIGQALIPEKWFQRMETIQTYEEDASAMGRIHAWNVAYRLASERPLLGAGFRPFTEETYHRFYPDASVVGADAHSIFFQVLGEHGFTGLTLFVALIAATFVRLRSIMRRARRDPDLRWIGNLAQMLEASLLAYVVSGLFLGLSYFDLFYTLVAVTVMLHGLVSRPAPTAEPVLTPALAAPIRG